MKRLLLALFLLCGCAGRGVLYTEQGLTAVEQAWDLEFYRRLEACKSEHEAQTPEAEQCFGPTYDLDVEIALAVESAVFVLREYWTMRAAGKSPRWRETMEHVGMILDTLPPEACERFRTVAGRR